MHERRSLVALLLGALALRLVAAFRAPILESDGTFYASLAMHWLRGEIGLGISTVWPPLYPALIAAAARVATLGGATATPELMEASARAVSVLSGTLLLLPLWAIARWLLTPTLALVVVSLAAVHPRLIQYSSAGLSESTFSLLLLWALCRAMGGKALVAGMLMGAAYLARPEGLPIAAVVGLACWMSSWRSGFLGEPGGAVTRVAPASCRIRFAGRYAAGFALIALPYVLWVSAEVGRPSLGEKGAYNFWRAYRTEYDARFETPVGLNERIGESPELSRGSQPVPVRVVAFLAAAPGVVLARSARNLAVNVASSLPVAVYSVVVLVAALGFRTWLRRSWLPVVLPVAFLPVVYAPFTVDRRFFVPAVPLVLILAGAGLDRLAAWWGGARGGRLPRSQRLLPTTLLASAALLAYGLLRPSALDDAPEHRAAGIWLREHGADIRSDRHDGRVVVMARKPWVAYYGGALSAELPSGPLEDVLARARRKNATILVIDERFVPSNRPELVPLLDPDSAPSQLRLIHRADSPRRILLYSFEANAPRSHLDASGQ